MNAAIFAQAAENLRGRTFPKGRKWNLPDEATVLRIAESCEHETFGDDTMDCAEETLRAALEPYRGGPQTTGTSP